MTTPVSIVVLPRMRATCRGTSLSMAASYLRPHPLNCQFTIRKRPSRPTKIGPLSRSHTSSYRNAVQADVRAGEANGGIRLRLGVAHEQFDRLEGRDCPHQLGELAAHRFELADPELIVARPSHPGRRVRAPLRRHREPALVRSVRGMGFHRITSGAGRRHSGVVSLQYSGLIPTYTPEVERRKAEPWNVRSRIAAPLNTECRQLNADFGRLNTEGRRTLTRRAGGGLERARHPSQASRILFSLKRRALAHHAPGGNPQWALEAGCGRRAKRRGCR